MRATQTRKVNDCLLPLTLFNLLKIRLIIHLYHDINVTDKFLRFLKGNLRSVLIRYDDLTFQMILAVISNVLLSS